jgi:hypothetical protein
MDITHKTLKSVYDKVSVARFTVDNFFTHVNDQTEQLDSEKFVLDGLSTKFHLRVYVDFGLHYYLLVDDMAGEKSIQVSFKFSLENDKGEKCAETQGKILLI